MQSTVKLLPVGGGKLFLLVLVRAELASFTVELQGNGSSHQTDNYNFFNSELKSIYGEIKTFFSGNVILVFMYNCGNQKKDTKWVWLSVQLPFYSTPSWCSGWYTQLPLTSVFNELLIWVCTVPVFPLHHSVSSVEKTVYWGNQLFIESLPYLQQGNIYPEATFHALILYLLEDYK